MAILNVTDGHSLERVALVLSHIPKGVEKASRDALRRSLSAGGTVAKKEAKQIYAVRKSGDISGSLTQTVKGLSGELVSKGRALPLSHFKFSPKSSSGKNNRKPIRVTVKNGATKSMRTAFAYNGQIFTRVGSSRYPIQKRFTVSAPQMIENEAVRTKVSERIEEVYESRLNHMVEYLLAKG